MPEQRTHSVQGPEERGIRANVVESRRLLHLLEDFHEPPHGGPGYRTWASGPSRALEDPLDGDWQVAHSLARRLTHGIRNRRRHRYCCHLTETLHPERARLFWAAARATSAALMPSSARL